MTDTTKFYEYRQNNTGGSFEYDADAGISRFVIIEATSADDANERAERIGLYFEGRTDGRDCSCCGDRWRPAVGSAAGKPEPMYYGNPVRTTDFSGKEKSWIYSRYRGDVPQIFVHNMDGTVEGFWE